MRELKKNSTLHIPVNSEVKSVRKKSLSLQAQNIWSLNSDGPNQ